MLRVIIELNDPKDEAKQVSMRVFDELCQSTNRELAIENDILKRLGLRVMHQEESPDADLVRHVTQRFITQAQQKPA